MVRETQLKCFSLAVCYRTNANRQSTNPAIVRKRGDMFACCSVRFIAGPDVRSPDAPHTLGLWRLPGLVRVRHRPDGFLMVGKAVRRPRIALSLALFLSTPIVAMAEDQAITVGPWTIATSSRGDKFDSCTMSRSTDDLEVTFIRDADGLLLLLESPKWRLERGKAYPVTLIAGSRSIEVKAAAEPKGVSVPLTDRPLNERMRTANILEVVGEAATLRVPLDGSTAALTRLEACFEKNSRQNSDTNPFVAPNRKP